MFSELTDMGYIFEGRREDVLSKESDTYMIPDMSLVDDEFNVNTNYKYLKWMVDIFNKESVDFSEVLDYVKRFDKVRKNLEKKDINQYNFFDDLKKEIDKLGDTKSEKKSQKEILYEDDDFLVVRPLSQDASCYYGSGTKWCTSGKKKNKFDEYFNNGFLYYIISKKPLEYKPNWTKVAVYIDKIFGGEVFYDNLDVVLRDSEVKSYVNMISELPIMDSIRSHYKNLTSGGIINDFKSQLSKLQNKTVNYDGHVIEYDFSNEMPVITVDGEVYNTMIDGSEFFVYSMSNPIVERIQIHKLFDFFRDDNIIGRNAKVLLSLNNYITALVRDGRI